MTEKLITRKLKILVIDGSDDWTVWITRFFSMDELKVFNVADMFSKIMINVGTDKIRTLNILGHGRPGYQAVGAGINNDKTGEKSLSIGYPSLKGNAGIFLKHLRGKFTEDAIVTLGGCQTGKGVVGTELLKEVSRLVGVPVQAGVENQRPLVPGMEGQVKRCTATTESLLPSTWQGNPGDPKKGILEQGTVL